MNSVIRVLYFNGRVYEDNDGVIFEGSKKAIQIKRGISFNALKKKIGDKVKLQNNEIIIMNVTGEDFEVTSTMVDIRIDAKEGFNVGMENNDFVIINTTLTKELTLEGIAREIVSKVQQMRKTLDLELTDRITINYEANESIKEAILEFEDYIKRETLSTNINEVSNDGEELSIGEDRIKIAISKN